MLEGWGWGAPWRQGCGVDTASALPLRAAEGGRATAFTSCAQAAAHRLPTLQVVAFAAGPGSPPSRAVVINAHTGAVVQTLSADVAAEQLLRLPQPLHDDSADQHAFLLVPASGAAQLLPDTPAARDAWAAARPSLSFWRVDEAAGALRGLGFNGEAGGREASRERGWRGACLQRCKGCGCRPAPTPTPTHACPALSCAPPAPQPPAPWRSAGRWCWRRRAAACAS